MADQSRSPDTGADPDRGEGMPRWVKVFGIIIIVLVLLAVVVLLTGGGGGHGPLVATWALVATQRPPADTSAAAALAGRPTPPRRPARSRSPPSTR